MYLHYSGVSSVLLAFEQQSTIVYTLSDCPGGSYIFTFHYNHCINLDSSVHTDSLSSFICCYFLKKTAFQNSAASNTPSRCFGVSSLVASLKNHLLLVDNHVNFVTLLLHLPLFSLSTPHLTNQNFTVHTRIPETTITFHAVHWRIVLHLLISTRKFINIDWCLDIDFHIS